MKLFKYILAFALVALMVSTSPATATIDFSALTDLMNATFGVLEIITTNGSTLIELVVLFGTLGLVSIVIYMFIGSLLRKLGNMNMGGR